MSAIMQQVCFLLEVDQVLIPVYHPQANPVERKNRDLKPRLAILVGDDHTSWSEKLPTIRFAMNTARCETTGQTAAFLQFGRELRTTDDITHDLRGVISNNNFVVEITPYLKNFVEMTKQVKDVVERKQDDRKRYADKNRKAGPQFNPGDKVWVERHSASNSAKNKTAKFMPRRDGPFIIVTQRSPTTFQVANIDTPNNSMGVYNVSALTPCSSSDTPVAPLRKRGRPKKNGPQAGSLPGRRRNQRGSV